MSTLETPAHLVKHPRRVPAILISRMLSHRKSREMLYPYVDWRDGRRIASTEFAHLPLPPASLRFRVHGDLDLYSFMQTGRQCSEDIRSALSKVGRDIGSFENILDFGCGCGRTLIWLDRTSTSSQFYGTDIDTEAINWCRHHVSSVHFQTNEQLPPLPYCDAKFDLVYAISIFTHLSEEYQFYWLEEIKRVVRSGGYFLPTIRGDFHRDKMSPQELHELQRTGFLFAKLPKGGRGIFPEYYQIATQSRDYILANYSRFFEICAFVANGLDHCQDVLVLRKR
jgi:ubiquinone/menaquinone biosynthesis C-methylase UbiE